MGGFAWVTLATNDSYALGALVLAHSLRRAGTPHDLVALVTPGVSAAMRNQLSSIFTLVKDVNVLDSHDEAHLALLERPELGVTFTKLHCWCLTQYEKCVFLDADTLVLKNSDELFEREELSAAPDPGWPDCFNSGVFVYRPSLDTFNALIQFALSKGSFDGGDQGLLNLFFSDWATKDISRHLPFIYNMVSTATYSYLPAYKQFGENAKIVHFIGANKPWLQYFDSETQTVHSPQGAEHLQSLLQLWWNIFCSTVHPTLSPEMLGLAGALAQLTLGAPRSAEQAAFEEHMRRQAWEQGTMDYMGRDSFDNIWRKISETLAQAPQKPEEVPPTKSASEPKLPESKVPEPKSPADSKEAPGLTSSTAPTHQSSKGIETPSSPTPTSEEGKSTSFVPHTPSIIEATPPTSPPIVIPTAPIADIQALKVDAPPPDTPPVGSLASELTSTIEPTTVQTAKPTTPADTVPQDIKSQPPPVTESSEVEQIIVIEQKQTAETIETPSQDIPVCKEVTPTQEQVCKEIPISQKDEKVSDSTASEMSPSPQVSESPVYPNVEKVDGSTVPTQVSAPKETPVSSDGVKVPEVSSVTQVSAPKETPIPSDGGKVPEVPPVTQVSAPKETPIPSDGGNIPEVPPVTQVSAPKETPVSSGDGKIPEVLPVTQVSVRKETPIPSGGGKFPEVPPVTQISAPKETPVLSGGGEVPELSPITQVSAPKETPAPSDGGKVPEVPPITQVCAHKETPEYAIKEIPVSSGDEKVIDSTVAEISSSSPLSAYDQTSTSKGDDKVVSSTVPEVLPSSQVSELKITSEVPPPSQVSAPEDISTPLASEKVTSSPATEVPPPSQVSISKEIPTAVADKKTVVSSVSEVTPLPLVSKLTETTLAAADEKIVSSAAPQIPPSPQVSDTQETAKSIAASREVQPLQVSVPKEVSLPESKKEPSSAPIVAEAKKLLQTFVSPPSPSTPLVGAPEEEKPAVSQTSKKIPAKSAAPTVPQAPVTQPPAEKEIPASQELPVSSPLCKDQAAAVPVDTSKTPSGDKLVSKEPKLSDKKVSDESKSVPAPTSSIKLKPAAKKAVDPKEPTPPQTPDAPPSEQAPVPPKRRGHKGASAAPGAEQGASSKPTQPQPQQSKGSKPGQQKSKK